MELITLKSLFITHRETALYGRYIHGETIKPLLDKIGDSFKVDHIGVSVNKLPIYSITFGEGGRKVLMWSQMAW